MSNVDKAFELVQTVGDHLAKAVPTAWQKLIEFHYWYSVAYLGIGFALLVLSALFIILGLKLKAKGSEYSPEYGLTMLFKWGFSILGAFLLVGSAFQLLNIWNWVGAFNPEARLVYTLFVKTTGVM